MMRIITERTLKIYAQSFPDAAKSIHKWIKKVKSSDCCINIIEFKEVWSGTSYIGNKRFKCEIMWNRYRLVVGMDPKKPKTIFIRWFGTHSDYNKLSRSGEIYNV